MSYHQNPQTQTSFFLQIIKGGVLSLLFSVLFALGFSLILLFSDIPDSAILPVNQTLKILSIALAVFCSVREEKGWIKGGIIGVVATMLTTFAFSFLGGGVALGWLIFVEMAYCAAAGAVMGMVSVNVFR